MVRSLIILLSLKSIENNNSMHVIEILDCDLACLLNNIVGSVFGLCFFFHENRIGGSGMDIRSKARVIIISHYFSLFFLYNNQRKCKFSSLNRHYQDQ